MVDTGTQSTAISCSMLHQIGKHMKSQGKEFPQLQKLSVHLYGKRGADDKNKLNITAETVLTIEADEQQVQSIVFVLPDTEQPCLLGTNAAVPLKLS